MLVAGSLFAMFAGDYGWSPRWTGVMYSERRGQWHFWLSFVTFTVTFFATHFLGLAGMPRRDADSPMQFADVDAIVSVGAFAFALAQVYFAGWIVVPAIRGKGAVAPQRPWEGAEGPKWELPAPLPHHTFETPPQQDGSGTWRVAAAAR